jgi:predicted transcriptional regulator
METISVTPQRKAQLEQYAQRHGQDAAAALDEVLATYFEWEQQDYREALAGIREGIEDVKAGRRQSVDDVFEELRVKHGLPG